MAFSVRMALIMIQASQGFSKHLKNVLPVEIKSFALPEKLLMIAILASFVYQELIVQLLIIVHKPMLAQKVSIAVLVFQSR